MRQRAYRNIRNIRKVRRDCGLALSDEELREQFLLVDCDGSGSISAEEFEQLLGREEADAHSSMTFEAFSSSLFELADLHIEGVAWRRRGGGGLHLLSLYVEFLHRLFATITVQLHGEEVRTPAEICPL